MRGLREVRRPAGRLPDWDGAVRRYLEAAGGGGDVPGWEPRRRAERRIRRALDAMLARHAGVTVAAVSHGTVLALYARAALGEPEPYGFWRSIPFGGWARVDPERGRLLEGFGRP